MTNDETPAEDTPWYDGLITELTRAQLDTRDGHLALSQKWATTASHLRALADNCDQAAAVHERLASYVPNAAQAAADLGVSTDRHDLDNLRTIVLGEQGLSKLFQDDVEQLKRDVAELKEQRDNP